MINTFKNLFNNKKIFSNHMSSKLDELYKVIRNIRDQKGDDRCWMDYEELFKLLPEGYTPPERDTEIELENCRKFIKCSKNPATTYISPQRRIEELEKEVEDLKLKLYTNKLLQ